MQVAGIINFKISAHIAYVKYIFLKKGNYKVIKVVISMQQVLESKLSSHMKFTKLKMIKHRLR